MSFLVLPPEINSSLMFTGAGSAPMLAAAAAWDGLATELGSAAQSFSSITSGLTGQAWQGAASAAMLSTATRYTEVLTAATTQAETAAAQAQAVVSAFESAQSAAVHPALVAANRNQVVQLVLSNLFGQNAPTIAAVESDYERMWAQDVAAMVGYHGGASAAAAQLPSWSSALQGLSAELSGAVAGNPAGSALSSLNSAASSDPLGGLLGTVQQDVINVINAPTEFLLGVPLINTGPSVSLGGNGQTGTVPLSMVSGTEPVVNASVGSGAPVPLLVDTGSTGLVIPFQKVGGLLGVLQLGLPSNVGIGGYSGGLDYVYATYNAPVNFGGGLVTRPTPVDVELFAWPTSIQSALTNGLTFQSYFAPDGVSGVLGVGPNAGGPGPSIPTQALPGSYGQGVLINESVTNPYLQFGPPPSGLQQLAVLNGSPITTLDVSVNGGPLQSVPSIIDSGGVNGTIPSSVIGNAPAGTHVSVYNSNGSQLLYSYTTGGTNSPSVISSGLMNTGYLPYSQHPIYISYSPSGVGTTYIY